jgi:hypothetical protein
MQIVELAPRARRVPWMNGPICAEVEKAKAKVDPQIPDVFISEADLENKLDALTARLDVCESEARMNREDCSRIQGIVDDHELTLVKLQSRKLPMEARVDKALAKMEGLEKVVANLEKALANVERIVDDMPPPLVDSASLRCGTHAAPNDAPKQSMVPKVECAITTNVPYASTILYMAGLWCYVSVTRIFWML